MSSRSSSVSTPKDIESLAKSTHSALGNLLRYCELQDKQIAWAIKSIKWLSLSQIAILVYLIFML